MSFDVSTSEAAKAARHILESRLQVGKARQNEIVNAVASTHIRDRLVPPKKMSIMCSFPGKPQVFYDAGSADVAFIHQHALGQLASVAGIPKTYVNRLVNGSDWERNLFCYNMNTLFHEGEYLDRQRNPTKYLHRLVGSGENTELRGFLSRSFNRHLASLPLLRAFVESCNEVGAQTIDGTASPVRFSLKMFLPHIFEPVPGHLVAFGESWSNSDFGAGRMKVSMSCLNIRAGTMATLEDSMSRVHLGSIIQESDIEVSDQTAIKEVEAQCSAIRDVVREQLQPEPVGRMLALIAAANEEQIPWNRIKNELGRLLHKSEIEDVRKLLDDTIDELPPVGRAADGSPLPTRWWASNVVGWLAAREVDPDRREDLHQLAGDILVKAA